MSNKVRFVKIGNTPAFLIPGNKNDSWGQVFGCQYVPKIGGWVCPAYRPFLDNVVRDIETLNENVLDESIKKAAYDFSPSKEKYLQLIQDTPPPGKLKSYAHQLEGTAELLANYRWYLRWEMGTGKTKVAVDAMNYLRVKTIVVCPVIAIDTWHKEIELHSAGTITSISIQGTPKQKIKQLEQAKDFDVVIVSYDTARLYSIPTVCAKANALRKKSQMGTTKNHLKVLDSIAELHSQKEQINLLSEFYAGKLPADDVVTIVNQTNKGFVPFLCKIPFEMIILDEGHRVKSIKSQRTHVISQLATNAPRRYLLSGTPTIGDPRDFYTQLRLLSPFLMPEEWFNFVSKFCVPSLNNKHVVTHYKNMNIINDRVNSVSSERKLLDCVDLPQRIDVNVYYNLTGDQLLDYNDAVSKQVIHHNISTDIDFKHGAMRLTKLMQICSGFYYVANTLTKHYCDDCTHLYDCVACAISPGSNRCKNPEAKKSTTSSYKFNPKAEALAELLEDILADSEHKVIIWGNYIEELNDIESVIKKAKYGYVRVDGSNTKHIKEYEQKFQTNPDCRVYIGQINTGIAITLTAAKYAVYYSRSWSIEAWDQSRGRNFRIGQTQSTVVYRLVGRYSVEKQQLIALDNRHDIATVLTKRIECVTCDEYEVCVAKGIEPWCDGCVMDAKMERYKTNPQVITTEGYPVKEWTDTDKEWIDTDWE